MSTKISFRQIRRNIGLSIFAQAISLIVSFLMNLILPKYISEYQYAYWHTYLLYVGYVGIFHFGLLDGMMLRYSSFDYGELDKPRIRSQFRILLYTSTCFTAAGMWMVGLICKADMRIALMFVAAGIICRNLFNYTSFTCQMTNQIHKYAGMIIGYRIFYGLLAGLFLMLGLHNFYYFCIVDLCSDLFGICMGMLFNKELYFGKAIGIQHAKHELKENISSGIIIMTANWSSFLLTGSASMIIQWRWDELVFGLVSFSFSVINLFLNFVSAISVVLFPSLKRIPSDQLSELYIKIKNGMCPFLICILIMYYPGCWILEKWLPAYTESLKYLGILLPIIIPLSKVSLLTNNYLKALRQERKMLIINIATVLLAISAYIVSAYIAHSLHLVLISIVFVLEIRSIVSELEVRRNFGIQEIRDFIIEVIMMGSFIFSASQFNLKRGFLVYMFAIIVYAVVESINTSK